MDWQLGLILGALVLAAVIALWQWLRHRRTAMPKRIVDPGAMALPLGVRAWQLQVPDTTKACGWAREWADKRFVPGKAVKLPASGCSAQCQCHYLPVREHRRGPRREKTPPGMDLAFASTPKEAKQKVRRKSAGRRSSDSW